ncbi:MAG: hypothetical protein Q7R95_00190 [bacterium]|nr:hypothetical protein [bacterium]
MNSLKKTILKKVYILETKNIIFEIIIRIVLFISVVSLAVIMVVDIVQKLAEQQTLDVLQLFQEDFYIIKLFFGEVMGVFFTELPKFQTGLFALSVMVFFILFLFFMKNYFKIKNKIKSLKKYWIQN